MFVYNDKFVFFGCICFIMVYEFGYYVLYCLKCEKFECG